MLLAPTPVRPQGLGWMLAREQQREAVGRGLLQLHPEWTQLVTSSGAVLYVYRYEATQTGGLACVQAWARACAHAQPHPPAHVIPR